MSTNAKHSSGDLHSRLKTRKILGVGETDNGDIHRSKISQLLGHNEHLYVKFPRGYWCWHVIMAVSFTVFGLNNLFFPDRWWAIEADANADDDDKQQQDALIISNQLAARYYGSASLAMALLLWSFWGTSDKSVARCLVLAVAFCHVLQALGLIIEHWNGTWKWQYYLTSSIRILLIVPSIHYYKHIGLCGLRMRKSNSFSNLSICNSTGNSTQWKKTD